LYLKKRKFSNFFKFLYVHQVAKIRPLKNNFTARDTEAGRQAGRKAGRVRERVLQMMASQGKGLRKQD
jgi:hypothetical protein